METYPTWLTGFLKKWPRFVGIAQRLDYMPLYINKFLTANAVEEMEGKQRSAYLMLLARAWQQTPPASIPDDDKSLARWTGMNADEWKENREAIVKPFTKGPDGEALSEVSFGGLDRSRYCLSRSAKGRRKDERKA